MPDPICPRRSVWSDPSLVNIVSACLSPMKICTPLSAPSLLLSLPLFLSPLVFPYLPVHKTSHDNTIIQDSEQFIHRTTTQSRATNTEDHAEQSKTSQDKQDNNKLPPRRRSCCCRSRRTTPQNMTGRLSSMTVVEDKRQKIQHTPHHKTRKHNMAIIMVRRSWLLFRYVMVIVMKRVMGNG